MMEVGPRKLMDFVEIWCVIENVFLATTDESLGRSMRIPTEEQPRKILEVLGCPSGYQLPCIIGIGHIAEGAEYINRVMVRRFKVDPIRDMSESEYLKRAKPVRRLRMFLYRIRGLRLFSYFIPVWTYYRQEELESMRRCVFYSSQLHQFIKENKDVYKAFIALTIDYTPFYYTAILAGEKSIAIPTMHYTKISFRGVLTEAFSKFAYVGFNTKAEQKLGERVFGKALGAHGIISVGIEPIKAANWEETKRKYRLPDKYLLCVGRVEKAKVNDLITCFSNYKQQYKESSLKLVMVGGIFGKVPDAAEVIYTGFVSDEEKIAIIQHAFLVVNPSQYESLSLICLLYTSPSPRD